MDENNRENPPAEANLLATGDRDARRYNLVILGCTPLGYHAALEAARLGARVALAPTPHDQEPWSDDRAFMRALAAVAHVAQSAREAIRYGVRCGDIALDFTTVMRLASQTLAGRQRMQTVAALASAGVEVFTAPAKFSSKSTVDVDGRRLQFQKALIASGARPKSLSVPSSDEVETLDERSLTKLTALPARLIVVGAGLAGCAHAQTFRRLGSEVQLVEHAETILPSEEPYAAEILQRQLERDGVRLQLGWTPIALQRTGGAKSMTIQRGDERLKLIADEILINTGHLPNVEDCGLEKALVTWRERGIAVDDFLRTSNPAIHAAGDVCGSPEEHTESLARIVVRNSLLMGRSRASRRYAPRVSATSPQVARIGFTRAQAAEVSLRLDSFRLEFAELDAVSVGQHEEGYVVLHVERGKDRLLGATIVAEHAGEMIGELSLAMNRQIGLTELADSLHPRGAAAEIIGQLATRHRPARMPPKMEGWISKWLAWRRGDQRRAKSP